MPAAKTTTTKAAAAPVVHDSLAAALVAFQAECPTVAKSHTARIPTKGGAPYTYTYADLADTSDAILPVLTRHGMAFIALPRQEADGRYSLVGTLVHTSGEKMEGAVPLHGRTPQEIGSSLTYMRRYLLCAMTGVVADDDDDGARAQAAEGRTQGSNTDAPKPEPEPEPGPAQQIVLDRIQSYDKRHQAVLMPWWNGQNLPAPAQLTPEQCAWVMERLDEYDQRAADAAQQEAQAKAADQGPNVDHTETTQGPQ